MSVTIYITNNREYCDANCPELIEQEDFSDIAEAMQLILALLRGE
jgi:hypothetical protein